MIRIMLAAPLLTASDILFNLGAIVAGSSLRRHP
jgi:hypothetical protein